jgi:hypothetical protein
MQHEVERARERERIGCIEFDELEAFLALEVCDVLSPPGEEAVDADDLPSTLEKAIAQVRTDESGGSGEQGATK